MAHDHLTDPNMPDDLRALAARVEAGEDPDEVHGIERLWLYRVARDKDAWERRETAFCEELKRRERKGADDERPV